MDVDGVKNEEKPDLDIDKDDFQHEEDPDEVMTIGTGQGKVWLVKIPKHILERWSAVNNPGVELAKLRIYNDPESQNPKMFITVPAANPNDPPELFALDVHVPDAASSHTQMVVAERHAEQAPSTSRRRMTVLAGVMQHECNMRPLFSEAYRARVRAATRASVPKKRMRILPTAGDAGMKLARLSTGIGGAHNNNAFAHLGSQKGPKGKKKEFERMARAPRNQLLDMLFQLFTERPTWGVKDLRARTQQPEGYLKAVLADIATLHRSGEKNGMWELKELYRNTDTGREGVYKMETKEEEEEEESDEDEDMEEVA
ncbi:unnamed protein product [Peniophora sp. CBMAI 1063]|nr:unnamed protein product [Peniophora sp. CBMAI 1063]